MRENRLTERTRQTLRRCVEDAPGITVPMLSARTGFVERTVRRHLAQMIKRQLVSAETVTGRLRLYVRSHAVPSPQAQRLHALFSEDDRKHVYDGVHAEGTTPGRVATRCGMDRRKVLRILADLHRHGLVDRVSRTLWRRTGQPYAVGEPPWLSVREADKSTTATSSVPS